VSDSAQATVAEPVKEPRRRRKTDKKKKPRHAPRYQVILWDDDHHTYAYVMVMLMKLFGFKTEKAYKLAEEVDTRRRAILITTTQEHAELKRDQIHAFGPDQLIAGCKGSMWATIERVPE
jgi:ATP-dependent Clp protease adaptor protein ClpS